jgi:UDP-2-acetamido-3-amino-2,3-dideoxy-glucuronate N-acetyltransferase
MCNKYHPTAIIESDYIGVGTCIWAFSHISVGAVIGDNCVIGEGVHIGKNVKIGNNCKIQNHSLIYEGVIIGDFVFIGPNVVTTNDLYPSVRDNWETDFRHTYIKDHANICANSTIVCGNIIGEYATVGAGSVVTTDIRPGYLAYGNPARHIKKNIN